VTWRIRPPSEHPHEAPGLARHRRTRGRARHVDQADSIAPIEMQLPIVSTKLHTTSACAGATGTRKPASKMEIEAPGRNDLNETSVRAARGGNVERMRKRGEASRRRGAPGRAANDAQGPEANAHRRPLSEYACWSQDVRRPCADHSRRAPIR
jgi:hypothetical protein